jgi:ferredoxin-type protein NapH
VSRRLPRWAWARRGTAMSFLALLWLSGQSWFPWFRGSTTGTRLLDVVVFNDPLAALELMIATRTIHSSVFTGAALLLVVALALGPVFCGWVCPLGLLLDLHDGLGRRVRRWLGERGNALPSQVLPHGIRYAILGLALGFSALVQIPIFQTVSPINAVGWAVTYQLWTALLLVVLLIAAVEIFAPRIWCRSLCPLGALYSVIGRGAPLRVWIDPSGAGKTPCRKCTISCPMGIAVMEDYTLKQRASIDHAECTRCGNCVDACPRGVLKLALRFRGARPVPVRGGQASDDMAGKSTGGEPGSSRGSCEVCR